MLKCFAKLILDSCKNKMLGMYSVLANFSMLRLVQNVTEL